VGSNPTPAICVTTTLEPSAWGAFAFSKICDGRWAGLAALGLPTVIVQEGGYDLETIEAGAGGAGRIEEGIAFSRPG
jgi:hypothetical protein